MHGLFWSGLLTAAGAYVTDLMPASRRAEGIGYYGISTILAVAVAPAVGLWVYQHGWLWLCVSIGVLNLTMAIIATQLAGISHAISPRTGTPWLSHEVMEWRVTLVSLTLFLMSFGYGGVTSFVAIYAREHGVTPPSLYFTVCARRDAGDAAVFGDAGRSLRSGESAGAVYAAGVARVCAAGGGRDRRAC